MPRKIIVVNKTGDIAELIKGVRDGLAKENNLHDRENVLHDVVDVQEAFSHAALEYKDLVIHNRYMVDEGYRRVDAQWYVVWISKYETLNVGVHKLDQFINQEMGKVCMLRPENHQVSGGLHGFCILSFLHKTLGGFVDTKGQMEQAMEELSKIDDKQHMIKDWSEINGSS